MLWLDVIVVQIPDFTQTLIISALICIDIRIPGDVCTTQGRV